MVAGRGGAAARRRVSGAAAEYGAAATTRGSEPMKLTDPTHGLKRTPLEAVELEGDTLDAHRDFWDRSAAVDSLTAIVTDSDERDYRSSGRAEAELLRRF